MDKTEARDVLKALLNRIDNQDNRCTAKPWFHLLRVKRRVFEPKINDGGWWMDLANPTEECIQASNDGEAAKELGTSPDEVMEMDAIESWDTVNVFLTQEGLQRHLDQNRHNIGEEYSDFMIHAFRNPEMAETMAAIRALVEA
jgi:hypothetical protein